MITRMKVAASAVGLFDQCADGLELGMIGRLGPFKDGSLGRCDNRPRQFEPSQGDVAVEGVARRDGVGGNLDPEAHRQQFEGCLGDADVCLDPGERHLANASAVQGFQHRPAPAGVKGRLGRANGYEFGHLGDARAEPLGILLGRCHGDTQQPGDLDQPDDIREQHFAAVDLLHELPLDVNDEEGGMLGVESFGRGHA